MFFLSGKPKVEFILEIDIYPAVLLDLLLAALHYSLQWWAAAMLDMMYLGYLHNTALNRMPLNWLMVFALVENLVIQQRLRSRAVFSSYQLLLAVAVLLLGLLSNHVYCLYPNYYFPYHDRRDSLCAATFY